MSVRAWSVVLWAVSGAGLCAQPGDGPDAPPKDMPAQAEPSDPRAEPAGAGSMEVAGNLWGVIGRYRYAATADRVRVTLVQPGGRSDMRSLVVRCVPGPAGLARLELGDLTLVARGGVLRAIHGQDPTTYAELVGPEGASPAGVVREWLPPLAIPQLSLAFDPAEVDWCPLVSGLAWDRAERVQIGGVDGVRLRGRTAVGEAMLVLAGARVRRFEADLDAAGETRLLVECEPLDPSDPAGWGLDISGRRRVEGLGGLRPLGARVGVGDHLPRARLIAVDDQPERRLGDEAEPGAFAESRLYLSLLLRDDMEAADTGAATGVAMGAMLACRREILRGRLNGELPERLRLVELGGVIQAQASEGMLERIASQSEAWRGAVEAALPGGDKPPALAWFADESRLIDRLSPGATAVLVMHDGSGRIRAVVPIGPGADPELVSGVLLAAVPVGPS